MSFSTKGRNRSRYTSFFDQRNDSNPFSLPDDDTIFSFREKDAKPKKRIQIWSRDRPTREG